MDWVYNFNLGSTSNEGSSMTKVKNLYKHFAKQKRDWIEAFLDCHNRKFEFIRTIGSVLGLVLQCVILLKVFGKI